MRHTRHARSQDVSRSSRNCSRSASAKVLRGSPQRVSPPIHVQFDIDPWVHYTLLQRTPRDRLQADAENAGLLRLSSIGSIAAAAASAAALTYRRRARCSDTRSLPLQSNDAETVQRRRHRRRTADPSTDQSIRHLVPRNEKSPARRLISLNPKRVSSGSSGRRHSVISSSGASIVVMTPMKKSVAAMVRYPGTLQAITSAPSVAATKHHSAGIGVRDAAADCATVTYRLVRDRTGDLTGSRPSVPPIDRLSSVAFRHVAPMRSHPSSTARQ